MGITMQYSVFALIILLSTGSMLIFVPATLDISIQPSFVGDEATLHQCRFWGMIADSLPKNAVLSDLVNLPYSLKNLGAVNDDGWGLAYYKSSQPVILRGEPPAFSDPNFDSAAQELAASSAHIGVGHVRAASSGAADIPDPHPFIRQKGGKWWAFGHNGGLDKTTLKNLIGAQYLARNPPTVGANWDDPDVVDSDLYMLYILKCVEESNWDVTFGIAKAVIDISAVDSGGMNFFFTDGETLWGFRKGNTLYYYYNATTPQFTVIASQPPTSTQKSWIPLKDYSLITLKVGRAPSIIANIRLLPPVGGVSIPLENLGILGSYIGFISAVLATTLAVATCSKRVKSKRRFR
jgi:predicted glutamine amidotransferase